MRLRGSIDVLGCTADADSVAAFVRLANTFDDGWSVPWYGPPVAELSVELYLKGEFVGDFGVGHGFVTRTYGNFWSQSAAEDQLREFRSMLPTTGDYAACPNERPRGFATPQ